MEKPFLLWVYGMFFRTCGLLMLLNVCILSDFRCFSAAKTFSHFSLRKNKPHFSGQAAGDTSFLLFIFPHYRYTIQDYIYILEILS